MLQMRRMWGEVWEPDGENLFHAETPSPPSLPGHFFFFYTSNISTHTKLVQLESSSEYTNSILIHKLTGQFLYLILFDHFVPLSFQFCNPQSEKA
jgi:hypothetical protein